MANALSIADFKRPGKEMYSALFVSNIKKGVKFKLKESGDPGTWVRLGWASEVAQADWNKKPINWDDVKESSSAKMLKVLNDNGTPKSPMEFLALGKLEKTEDFGSSKGSGGGSDATTSTESMCCYFAAYLFNGGPAKDAGKEILREGKFIPITDDKDILKYGAPLSKFFKAHPNLVYTYDKQKRIYWDDCWDFAVKEPIDKKWMHTYINTANVMKAKAKGGWTAPVYFYRGSKFVENIYEKKSNCQKHDRDLGAVDPVANMMNDDKWNPADIWMSTLSVDSDPFPWKAPTDTNDHACDWLSLKSAVAVAGQDPGAKERTLGISLKKQSIKARVSEWNPSEFDGEIWTPRRLKNKTVKYSGFTFGNGDFFGSTDIYLHFTGAGSPKIQYRAFDGTKSWQGQMTGAQASAGKLSGTPTNYYSDLKLKKKIGEVFPGYVDQDPWKEYKGSYPYPNNIKKKMWQLYQIYNKHGDHKDKKFTKIKVGIGNSKYPKYEGLNLPQFDDKTHPNWKPISEKKGEHQIWESKKVNVSEDDFYTLADNYYSERPRFRMVPHNFYFGKYMALALIYNIDKGRNKHAFARDIVRYAMSNASDISTYFWKVS